MTACPKRLIELDLPVRTAGCDRADATDHAVTSDFFLPTRLESRCQARPAVPLSRSKIRDCGATDETRMKHG
jgi:hypothetical protein